MRHLLRLGLVGAIASVVVGLGPSLALAVSLPTPSLPVATPTVPAVTPPPVSVPTVITPVVPTPAAVAPTPAVTVPPVSAPAVSAPATSVSAPDLSTPVARLPGGGSSRQPASGSTRSDKGGSTEGTGGGDGPSSAGTSQDASGSTGPGVGTSSPVRGAAPAVGNAATVTAAGGPSSAALPRGAALTAVSLPSSSVALSGSEGPLDEYLLGLVHDDLCDSLASILGPLPPRIDGLPGPVIRQLPAEVRNVVPRDVLAKASVRCEATLFDSSTAHTEPDAKLLALLAQTGLMVIAIVQVGLGLLCIGALLRHHARNGRTTAVAS